MFLNKSLLVWIGKETLFFYRSPLSLNYWWNFGSLSFLLLIMQIVTGVFLAMFYSPNMTMAFHSLLYINEEVYYGWFIRSVHANGASFFFFCMYVHMLRGLYYGSYLYPRQMLWLTGILIWFLMSVVAFLGYILPWGQMSFWAAMVITNLISAIPFIGDYLLLLLWGGFSIDEATLYRFYSLHYFLSFVLLLLTIIHIILLHEFGSTNNLGINSSLDQLPFSPLFVLKDMVSVCILLFFFVLIFTISPDFFGHSDNYNIADFLVTPAHIVPEWYFLPFYAVLRSVTDKLMGIILVVSMFLSLMSLTLTSKITLVRSSLFRPLHGFFFWIFLFDVLLLGWIGSLPVISPYVEIGLKLTIIFFFILVVCFPLVSILEYLLFLAWYYDYEHKE